MAARKVQVGSWHRLATNERTTAAQIVAVTLRRLADRIDGRKALVIDMQSIPPVPMELRQRIIRKGLDRMAALLAESAQSEAIEAGMRELTPELFDDRAEAE